ncbi:DUF3153 domain-containing protein [Candidatus Gracilibacteria bacterium]|nr:DUF3153 domain-containing protein [Candidatus Gracilibacteria bacterium]
MNKSFLLASIFCLLTLLTGCVRYEVGINFDNQHQGEIVQHIKLEQQLTTLSGSEAIKWLNSLEKRAAQLQGRTKRISGQEIVVTIPFGNGDELAKKFNEFFKADEQSAVNAIAGEGLDLVQLNSQMSVEQNNWLIVERNTMNLNVDLRALGVLSNRGNIIVSPGSLIDLEFILNTPWRASIPANSDSLSPDIGETKKQLIWHLQPGQINNIAVVFWAPNYIGIGTIAIALLMIAGFYLKYGRLPLLNEPIKTTVATEKQ